MSGRSTATPTITNKSSASTGKRRVVVKKVKNRHTKELVKTEVHQIEANGDTKILTYPAGCKVPSLTEIFKQTASASASPTVSSPKPSTSSDVTVASKQESKSLPVRGDVGPSIPTNSGSIDDLLEQERQLLAANSQEKESQPEVKAEENIETSAINLIKSKRQQQKDPKYRRRGLQASTINRCSENDDDDATQRTPESDVDDIRCSDGKEDEEDEEKIRQRKEEDRRRRAKRSKSSRKVNLESSQADEAMDVDDEDIVENPLSMQNEDEILSKKLQVAKALHQKDQEKSLNELMNKQKSEQARAPHAPSDDSSDSDKRKKKKKHKHKKKKKKSKKQKKNKWSGSDGGRDSGKELSDHQRRSRSGERNRDKVAPSHYPQPSNDLPPSQDGDLDLPKGRRSRSNSFSSISLASISSAFSDSFDFAEGDFQGAQDFDPSATDAQRGGFRGGFRGGARGGFDPFMRGGRGGFRGAHPGMRGSNRGWARGAFRGRGGAWYNADGSLMDGSGRGGRGRGGRNIMWGFGRNFDDSVDPGMGIHVVDSADSRSRSSSYTRSSYSYSSDSYYRRSRSRSRRHRRRSRSYSSSRSSRSSRSYSSRSSRSRSSRSSSRSSSYSRSSRSRSRGAAGWNSEDDNRQRSIEGIYNPVQDGLPGAEEEEVPWWADLDKTYDNQKEKEKQQALKKRLEKKANAQIDPIKTDMNVQQIQSLQLSNEDIDVVRAMMSVVDNACLKQDPVVEITRKCIADIVDVVAVNNAADKENSSETVVRDCIDDILDKVCGVETQRPRREKRTDERVFESLDKSDNKLVKCYAAACRVTAGNRMKELANKLNDQQKDNDAAQTAAANKTDDDDDKKRDRRGRRRKRGRRRRRRHSYSSSSSRSSRSRKRTTPIVPGLTAEQQQSLKQAQQMLILQLQQSSAAGVIPASLLPLITGQVSSLPAVPGLAAAPPTISLDPEALNMNLTEIKSENELTRKLMQRMKEKKQQEGGESPSFMARNKAALEPNSDKIFTGTAMKSRKIEFRSIDASKYSMTQEPNMFDETDQVKKGDTSSYAQWMNIEDSEKNKQVKRDPVAEQAELQRRIKEETHRQIRADLEKAERAKKEQYKQKILEEEKQKEIARIKEQVRAEVLKEVEEELKQERELQALREAANSIASKAEETAAQQEKYKKDQQEMEKWLAAKGMNSNDMTNRHVIRAFTDYMQRVKMWSDQQSHAYWNWHHSQQQQQNVPPATATSSKQLDDDKSAFPNATDGDARRAEQQPPRDDRNENPHEMMNRRGDTGRMMHPMDYHMNRSGPGSMMRPPMEGGNMIGHNQPQMSHGMPPRGHMTRPIRPMGPGNMMDNHMHPGGPPMRPRGPGPDGHLHHPGRPMEGHIRPGMRPNRPMDGQMHPSGHHMRPNRPMDGPFRHSGPTDIPMRPRGPPGDNMVNRGPPGDNMVNRGPPGDNMMNRGGFPGREGEQGPPMRHPGPDMRHDRGGDRMDGRPDDFNYGPDGRPGAPQGHDRQPPMRRDPQYGQQQRFNNPGQVFPPSYMDQRSSPGLAPNQRYPMPQQHVAPNNPPQQQQQMQNPRFYAPAAGPNGGGGNMMAPHHMQQHPSQHQQQHQQQPGPHMQQHPSHHQVDRTMIKQDEHAPGTTPPPGTDQPPPPGDEQLEHLQQQPNEGPSPVQDEVPVDDVPALEKEESEAEESVKVSKKKKKKSKKHRKKKDASSSDEDDKNLIMTLKKLQKLQKEKEAQNNNPDIEDGEVQSGEEDNAPNKSAFTDIKIEEMISQLKKKKKKHKKDKRKRKRKDSSSDEAPDKSSSKKLPPQMTPPAYSAGVLQMNKQQQGSEYEIHDYHQFHASSYNQQSYNDTDQRNKASPRAHHYAARDDQYGNKYRGYGAGEAMHHHARMDKFITGPEGDHSSSTGVQQRKQRPSPLPMIVPDDPNSAEMWEIQKRYDERMQQQRVSVSTANVNTQQLKQIVQTAGLVREQQRSAAIYHQDGRPSPHDHRKRPPTDSSAIKTKRQKRSYQDWDRPGDDNSQVYYYSGSEGSDKEYSRDERSPIKRGGDHEPRIIPVIGSSSKPQPIPTLASNRALGPASMQPQQQQQQQQRINPADPYYRGRYDYGGARRDDMSIVGGGGPRMPFQGGLPGGPHRTMMVPSHDGGQMMGRHHAPPARNPTANFQYDALPPGISRRPPHGMP